MDLPIRVIGIGSPHGDDAVAWEVIGCLRKAAGQQTGVELVVAEGGQRIFDWLDGCGSLVIVDALAGDRPGTVHRLEWPDPRVEMMWPCSTHGLRLPEALRLAGALGGLPARVVIFGIEGNAWEPGEGLSGPVATAVPVVVEQIRNELCDG